MPDVVIDPLSGPRFGVHGRVVTMNDDHEVVATGTVWVEAGVIRAVTPDGRQPPEGFDDVPVLRTGGTIFPGLIELHNHLPYNVLQMWAVPQLYGNRGQWGSHDDYRRLVSGPMKVLGKTAGYIEAVIRYVEVKALVAGVTTSQGVALYSNANTRRYHRGLVRNVEETNDPDLPEADTRVGDVEAESAASFLARLEKGKRIVLHLAEGLDETARSHFEALKVSRSKWAITDALVGIHAAALTGDDFEIFGARGGSMVWSPASNLMLYGGTARVDLARDSGVTVALGSDWAPTGSKNLLGELKVARAVARSRGWDLDDRDLVDMVTRSPAQAIGWDRALGSIEPGKRADLIAVYGRQDRDPYRQLIEATERSVVLVVINGVPRYGQTRFITAEAEEIRVGGSSRRLYLEQESTDPIVDGISFAEAIDRLEDGMSRLVELAEDLEALGATRSGAPSTALGIPRGGERWVIELEEESPNATPIGPEPVDADRPLDLGPVRGEKLSEILGPLELDPLTMLDDPGYARRLRDQANIPEDVAALL
ncbi:MAG TPA: amidohydrolase family protein [Acidimicrobiia bacterium]|nr:amidohydrolase family protein [Acidimicrobiia bacterium]